MAELKVYIPDDLKTQFQKKVQQNYDSSMSHRAVQLIRDYVKSEPKD